MAVAMRMAVWDILLLATLLCFLAVALQGCAIGAEGMISGNVEPNVETKKCKLHYDTQREMTEDALGFTIRATAYCSKRSPAASSFLQNAHSEWSSMGRSFSLKTEEDPKEVVLQDCKIFHPTQVKCHNGHRPVSEKKLYAWSASCVEKDTYKLLDLCEPGNPPALAAAEHDPKNLVAGTGSRHYPLNLDPKLQKSSTKSTQK